MRGDCKSPHEGSFLFPRTINLVTEASQIESPTSTQIGTSRPVTRMNGNSHHHHLRHQLNQRRHQHHHNLQEKRVIGRENNPARAFGLKGSIENGEQNGDNSSNSSLQGRNVTRRRRPAGVTHVELVWPKQYPRPRTRTVRLMVCLLWWTAHVLDWLSLLNLWPSDSTLLFKSIPWNVVPPTPPRRPKYNIIEPDW